MEFYILLIAIIVQKIHILKHKNNISLDIRICNSKHYFIPFLSTLVYRYLQLGYWYALSRQTLDAYRITTILHVAYSSLTACMNIKDLQNQIVLKICKYEKRTGTNSIAAEIKKAYMYVYGNKLLKGYQRIKMHYKTFTVCFLTVSGLLLVDVMTVRTSLANILEFIPIIFMGCDHKDVLARSPISQLFKMQEIIGAVLYIARFYNCVCVFYNYA